VAQGEGEELESARKTLNMKRKPVSLLISSARTALREHLGIDDAESEIGEEDEDDEDDEDEGPGEGEDQDENAGMNDWTNDDDDDEDEDDDEADD
jgi:hypothetical protein